MEKRQFKAGQDIAAAQQIISEGFVPLNQAVVLYTDQQRRGR